MVKSRTRNARTDDDDCSPPGIVAPHENASNRKGDNAEQELAAQMLQEEEVYATATSGLARVHQYRQQDELLKQEKKQLQHDDSGNLYSLNFFEEMVVPDTAPPRMNQYDDNEGFLEAGKLPHFKKEEEGISFSPTMAQIPPGSDDLVFDIVPETMLVSGGHGPPLTQPGAVAVPGLGASNCTTNNSENQTTVNTTDCPPEEDRPQDEPPLLNAELVRDDIVQATAIPKKEWWRKHMALLVFALITLGSLVRYYIEVDFDVVDDLGEGDYDLQDYYEEELNDLHENMIWVIAISSAALALEAILIAFHLVFAASISRRLRTRVEGVLCILIFVCWTAIVAFVNVENLHEGFIYYDLNIYYFTWAGFLCSLILSSAYMKQFFKEDPTGKKRFNLWCSLLLSSLVFMGECVTLLHGDEANGYHCSDEYEYLGLSECSLAKLGVALGASAATFSLLMIGTKISCSTAPFVPEASISVVLSIMYAVGAFYFTSPDLTGEIFIAFFNVYYSTWISLLLSVVLGSSCLEEYLDARSARSSEGTTGASEEP